MGTNIPSDNVPRELRPNIGKANWTVYKSSTAWRDLPYNIEEFDNEVIIGDLYRRFNKPATTLFRCLKRGNFILNLGGVQILPSHGEKEKNGTNIFTEKISPKLNSLERRERAKHSKLPREHKKKSCTENYSDSFKQYKLIAESTNINFGGNNKELYNLMFENSELLAAIGELKNNNSRT